MNVRPYLNRPLLLIAAMTSVSMVPSQSHAQLSVTSRDSHYRYDYVHGGGPDAQQGSLDTHVTNLLLSDVNHYHDSDETSGTWFDLNWATSVDLDIIQANSITGTLADASRIQSAGAVQGAVLASGNAGNGVIHITNPGNELTYYFTPNVNCYFQYSGHINQAGAFSWSAIQRYNGFNWDYVFLSYYYFDPNIHWLVRGTLNQGDTYRLIVALDLTIPANQSFSKDYAVDLKVVPEPALSGYVQLSDYTVSLGNEPVTAEIWQNGNLVETLNGELATNGGFWFNPTTLGPSTVKFQTRTGLVKAVNVNLDGHVHDLLVVLTNGDIDKDNEIGPGDFGLLSSAYGATNGDSNWVSDADLDGDGEIGPTDFGILSSHYGELGD